jgi:glycosyltransferase involved in cell wall biosynthesis
MRIVFNTYSMAFHTPGGGEMQLLKYKENLPKFGVDVDFFNLWQPHFLDYDLVHFFSLMGGSTPFCHFVKTLKLPLIVTSSLWITEETKHLYPFEEIKHQLSFADRVITNSKVESKQMASVFNMPIEKFAHVYNGIDPIFKTSVAPALFREHFNIQYPFILNVGNVEPRKNQLNLIKAMKAFPDLKLVVIGHARVPDYLKACQEEGGEQFVYLGALPHDGELLRSAYAACEAFALPSTLETPGLAALEAAASGAKVVVTGVGAAREYFADMAFYVDHPDSVDEIVRQIKEALSADKAKSALLAKHVQSHFLWESVVAELVKVYNTIL